MTGRELIAIKGSREGLTLLISERIGLEEALAALRARVEAGPQFFAGARVNIARPHGWDDSMVPPIAQALREAGVAEITCSTAPSPQPAKEDIPGRIAHMVRGTVRNGQRVSFRGDLIVIGDVNPGAELVAGGNIIVMGILRGSAHAGATGDAEAFICAFSIQPIIMRIAGVSWDRPPSPAPSYPELARLAGDRIVVEPYLPSRK